LHADIWGLFSVASVHRHRYFLTLVDDHSRHTWMFIMKNKSETRSLFNDFVKYARTQFSKNVKIIRSDNGSEFNYKDFYNNFGIIHQTTCVETPQ